MLPPTLVVIPAAGSGTRFGGELPKQYRLLAGRAILEHVIERFFREPAVAKLIVCVADDRLETMQKTVHHENVEIVVGGATRQRSVSRGLLAAAGDNFELVAVHDAVRPFFRPSTFRTLLQEALQWGGAVPCLPVADTIHGVRDGVIAVTLDRGGLVAAQTPQCFRLQLLRDVLEEAERRGDEGTDEGGLAAQYGFTVRVVPGDPMNFKITRPEDLALAEAHFQEWSQSE